MGIRPFLACLVSELHIRTSSSGLGEETVGRWVPNQDGDIRTSGEMSSLTNESRACQHLATQLKAPVLVQFSQELFFSVKAVCFQKLPLPTWVETLSKRGASGNVFVHWEKPSDQAGGWVPKNTKRILRKPNRELKM